MPLTLRLHLFGFDSVRVSNSWVFILIRFCVDRLDGYYTVGADDYRLTVTSWVPMSLPESSRILSRIRTIYSL